MDMTTFEADEVQFLEEMETELDKCRGAERSYQRQELLTHGYELAVFAVAAATAISLIVAIGFALAERPAGAIAGAIGTVVTGAAMGFVIKMRNDARRQREVLRKIRDRYCR